MAEETADFHRRHGGKLHKIEANRMGFLNDLIYIL